MNQNTIDYSWDFSKEEFSLDLDYFNEKEQEDKMWQARTGLNLETLCGAIETIIFMSDRPIELQKIKNIIDSDLPLRVVHESIARLQEEYELKHHGIRLMEVANGYQFRTKATYSSIIQKIFKVNTLQLSPTALEVLSIIAYKQPISKPTIESIRGVDSSHIIRGLMDKRLVKVIGRSEELGRPSLMGTTQEFLEVFNLARIEDLPTEHELDELASASSVASISEIREVVSGREKERFNYDELSELDVLSESIKDIDVDTLFTKTLKDVQKQNENDGSPRKSAFDILEEYLNRTESVEMNKQAIKSDTLSSFMDPKAVSVTKDPSILFNVPDLDDDSSDEFNRELPNASDNLQDDLDFSEVDSLVDSIVKETLDLKDELEAEFKTDPASLGHLFKDSEEEAKALSEELDAAFDNLFGGESSLETDEVEDAEHAQIVEDNLSELDKSLELAKAKAKNLDLDIDFM